MGTKVREGGIEAPTRYPINWKNRSRGKSKFKIKELSSMYLFTLFYCLLEKILLKHKK